MLRNFRVIILIFTLCASHVYAQTSEIRILETRRENIQKLVRVYQDSLADLYFVIAELKAGNSVNYSDIVFHRKPQTINESKDSVLKNPYNSSKKTSNYDNTLNFTKTKSKPYPKQKIETRTNSSSSRIYQSKKYKKRVGAICNDGSRSYATGRGACSHHGGVNHWLVE